MQAVSKALPILSILGGLSSHFGKNYCYPSQQKILDLLADRLGVSMSIATLNRHFRIIVEGGFVKRTRRIRRDRVKGMMFLSTLYEISRKGYGLLARFRNGLGRKINAAKEALRRKSKKDVLDPEHPVFKPNGISYMQYLDRGGKRPSIKK